MLLELEHLGLGGVWVGVYPENDFIEGLKKILNIPKVIMPFSIVAMGYKGVNKEPIDRYYSDRVKNNSWNNNY